MSDFRTSEETTNNRNMFKLDIFKRLKKGESNYFLKSKLANNKTEKTRQRINFNSNDNKTSNQNALDEIEPGHLKGIDLKIRKELTGNPCFAWEFEYQEEPILAREAATFTCINQYGEGLLVGGISDMMIPSYHL